MATVWVTYTSAELARPGQDALLPQGNNSRSEAITSSGTTAQGSITAANGETVIKVSSASQAVAVTTGENPIATLAAGVVVMAGVPEYITIRKGHKVAVIDI